MTQSSLYPPDAAPRRLNRQTIYESSWVNLYVDRVEFPGGRIIERHHVVHFDKDSVAALAENAAGQLLLIESYRYITGTVEWELPAGRMEEGETALNGAEREVLEESGYASVDHRLIHTFYGLIGISNIIHHLVYCRVTEQVADFDPNEVRSVRWFARSEIESVIDQGQIRDAYTLIGLLLWLRGL